MKDYESELISIMDDYFNTKSNIKRSRESERLFEAGFLRAWNPEPEPSYICVDCGALNIKPCDNGDGKRRCESCAVKKYKGMRSPLIGFADLELLIELINRNGIGKAPSVTKRHGEWSEVLIAVGDDETAHITFPNEAIDNLRANDGD